MPIYLIIEIVCAIILLTILAEDDADTPPARNQGSTPRVPPSKPRLQSAKTTPIHQPTPSRQNIYNSIYNYPKCPQCRSTNRRNNPQKITRRNGSYHCVCGANYNIKGVQLEL